MITLGKCSLQTAVIVERQQNFRVPVKHLPKQRYIEIKFSIGARSHTKKLNYRTKILRMVQDLAIFERTGLFSTNALAERWGCELVTRAGDVL